MKICYSNSSFGDDTVASACSVCWNSKWSRTSIQRSLHQKSGGVRNVKCVRKSRPRWTFLPKLHKRTFGNSFQSVHSGFLWRYRKFSSSGAKSPTVSISCSCYSSECTKALKAHNHLSEQLFLEFSTCLKIKTRPETSESKPEVYLALIKLMLLWICFFPSILTLLNSNNREIWQFCIFTSTKDLFEIKLTPSVSTKHKEQMRLKRIILDGKNVQ